MAELDYGYISTLVSRARTGDSDAFAELYAATYQKEYRFAFNYLKDEYLAQDALQETYILALKNLYTLRDSKLFISWLNHIQNVKIDVCPVQRKITMDVLCTINSGNHNGTVRLDCNFKTAVFELLKSCARSPVSFRIYGN